MLTERSAHLLRLLVREYIKTGHGIPSKALADLDEVRLSSATVRNVLAELEAQGYLASPHTSAGRIPTAKGLRCFVDQHLCNPVSSVISPAEAFDEDQPTNVLIEKASDVLSQLSHWVGVVTVPKAKRNVLRHVEFLPLQHNRILVILVLNESEVQNRIITLSTEHAASDLRQVGQFLTEHFSGKELSEIRYELLSALKAHQLQADRIMKTAIEVADEAFEASDAADYVVTGESNLLALPQEGALALDQLQAVFEAFRQKREILGLLDDCLNSEGVQIFIGEESGFAPLKHCSIVTSSYTCGKDAIGVLGVIGPTRMAYDRVIPMVEGTAKLLSEVLNRR